MKFGERLGMRPAGLAALLTSTMLAGATPAGAAAVAAAPSGDTTLSEIIVTAQKREENLQNVPVSIQAFGTKKLEQLHVDNFNDYIKFLPSVVYQSNGPGTSNVFMRGVAADNQSNHSGSLPTVGTYLDEQPITTIGGALDIHVYDIARVESLAGPQGTLYGASSEAGTIRIITNKPQIGVFTGAADVEVNTVKHGHIGYKGEGFVNIPVTDQAAIRLVGWGEHDGGFIDNVPGTRQFSTIFGTTTFAGIGQGSIVNNAPYLAKAYNGTDIYGGRAALKLDLNDHWTVTPSIIAQDERDTGVFGYDPSVGDLQVSHFRPEAHHDRWYQAALTVEGKISDFDIVYSGGHMSRYINSLSDYTDYSFFYDKFFGYAQYFQDNHGNYIDPTQTIIGKDHFIKDSHELRVTSPKDYRFRFVGGLFYQRQAHTIFQGYQINNLADSNADPGVTSLSITGHPQLYWLTDELRVDRDYAAFGEASFDITPKLTVTGGIRVYKSDNSLQGFYGFNANVSSRTGEAKCFAPPTDGMGPCTNLNKDIKQTGETHKINLTYRIDSDKLVYFTYSTGFRPGGVNRNGNLPPYQPDFLTNYEVGWKTSWLNNSLRFNGAAYWEDWNNFQFSYLGLNSLTVVSNAGDARILGVESDVTWRATRQLTLNGSAAYTDAKLQQDFCGGQLCTPDNPIQAPKGTQLPVTPRFKINGTARYEFDLANDLHAHIQGSIVYQSSSWSDLLTQAPNPITGVLTPIRTLLGKQAAFATADFSVGVAKDRWTFDIYLINAFDTRAQLYRYAECTIQICGNEPYVIPSRPRTVSVKIGTSF